MSDFAAGVGMRRPRFLMVDDRLSMADCGAVAAWGLPREIVTAPSELGSPDRFRGDMGLGSIRACCWRQRLAASQTYCLIASQPGIDKILPLELMQPRFQVRSDHHKR